MASTSASPSAPSIVPASADPSLLGNATTGQQQKRQKSFMAIQHQTHTGRQRQQQLQDSIYGNANKKNKSKPAGKRQQSSSGPNTTQPGQTVRTNMQQIPKRPRHRAAQSSAQRTSERQTPSSQTGHSDSSTPRYIPPSSFVSKPPAPEDASKPVTSAPQRKPPRQARRIASFKQSLPPPPPPLPAMLQKNEHIYYQQVLSGLSEKAHEPLSAQMEALVQALQTSPVVRARRVDLLHVLQKFISAYYGNAPASSSDALVQGGEEDLGRFDVQPFGSVVIGIDNDTSDLDIVVLDRYFPHGCSDASIKLPHLYNMNNLASQLQRFSPLGDVVDIIPIRAKVPITKVKMSDGMAMDINVNEALGHKNTQLLKAYFDLVPNNLLPSLARFLKFHFKNRRLNDPSGSHGPMTFSSYSLLLMMVAYMQCVGAVPNLQAQTSHQDALKEHWWQRAKDRTHRTTIRHFDVSHMSQAPPGWQAKTVFADLSQAALGFFQHYANFPFDKQIVSIKEGGQMERSSPYGKKPKKKAWREKIEQEEISKEQTEAADEAQGFEAPAETDQQAFSYGTYRPPGHDPALMEPEEVEQPKQWREELIITQDPFDTIRNTSHNVDSRIGQHFIEECRRARDLILQGATLGEISSIGQLPPKLKEDNEETQSPRRVRRVLGQQDVAEKEKHKEKSQHLDGKVHQQGLSKQSAASPDVVHQPKATLADL